MSLDDENLRARFAELKKHDERTAPDFQQMWSSTARRKARSPWRVVVPVASLVAAAMLFVWCGARALTMDAAPSSSPVAVAPGAAPAGAAESSTPTTLDPAPLDFLLDTSGSASLMRSSGLDSNPLKGW
jgi:hypothetical protein